MSKKQTTEAPAAEGVRACLGAPSRRIEEKPEASEPQGETRSRVKIKKTTHVAGCIAAPGAVVNVSKETADRLVADGCAVILY